MLVSLAVGATLGLSLAAPPGPMNAVIAGQTVTRGWAAGVAAGVGAMTADACFFVLALVGLRTVVERYPDVRTAMLFVGGLLMLYLAVTTVRSAEATGTRETGTARGFGEAFALAITNPYQLTWWLTAGVGLLDPTAVSAFGYTLPATDGGVTVVGFFAGIALWITAFPAALALAADRFARVERWLAVASALVLFGFGVAFVYAGVA